MKSKNIHYISLASLIWIIISLFVMNQIYINLIQDKKTIPEENNTYHLSLVATGDALIHQPIYKDALSGNTYNFKPQLQYIKSIIQQYDLAYYNQETLFAGVDLGFSTYPRFNTPHEFGDAMLDAGFNIVSLANNHSFDKGMSGALNAVEYWKNTDVMWNGMNASDEERSNFIIKEKNGITYTMVSYTTLTNGLSAPKGHEYLVNLYNKEQVEKDIKSLRDKVDLIIVAMHWGIEYSATPSQSQINIANHLSECGVDIIIGTHPHVLQPISRINNTVVMWSLGNFISSQRGTERLTGALVSLDIYKTIEENNTIIEINNIEVELIYTYKTSGLRNYRVIPFSLMESKYLNNYQEAYQYSKRIITKMDDSITVKPMNQS